MNAHVSWFRWKSQSSGQVEANALQLVDKVLAAAQWLRFGTDCEANKDLSAAVRAFRTASRLFRDAGKMAQARGSLRLALRLSNHETFRRPLAPTLVTQEASWNLHDEAFRNELRRLDEWVASIGEGPGLECPVAPKD